MTAPDFDPALVAGAIDAGAEVLGYSPLPETYIKVVLAAVAAVAPALRAEGAPWRGCTGDHDCPKHWHEHGCYADTGQCSDPLDHDTWQGGLQRGMVEGARQVRAAVESVGDVHDAYPWIVRKVNEALARIEKGAGA